MTVFQNHYIESNVTIKDISLATSDKSADQW